MDEKNQMPVRKETIESLKNIMKNRRFILKDDGAITVQTLSNIKKYHYRLVQDIDESEWNLNDPSTSIEEGKAFRDIMKGLIAMNELADNKKLVL